MSPLGVLLIFGASHQAPGGAFGRFYPHGSLAGIFDSKVKVGLSHPFYERTRILFKPSLLISYLQANRKICVWVPSLTKRWVVDIVFIRKFSWGFHMHTPLQALFQLRADRWDGLMDKVPDRLQCICFRKILAYPKFPGHFPSLWWWILGEGNLGLCWKGLGHLEIKKFNS